MFELLNLEGAPLKFAVKIKRNAVQDSKRFLLDLLSTIVLKGKFLANFSSNFICMYFTLRLVHVLMLTKYGKCICKPYNMKVKCVVYLLCLWIDNLKIC